MMVKFQYPYDDWCYRGPHTVHAVFRDPEGRSIARTERGDRNGFNEFEIAGFKLVGPGEVLS